ncbi:MAG: Rne/Rng family ribonuclease [Bacteroidia bacterium]|nr:Rne/Rng family ribonuclease [Bacteroidia bacterium]
MKELVVTSDNDQIRIAVLENKKIVELHQESRNSQFSVGDIFLGRVRRADNRRNAAFINIGYEKDGFLHYPDLGPQIIDIQNFTKLAMGKNTQNAHLQDVNLSEPIDKNGKITDALKNNQSILVQFTKEAISTKGPRLSAELSLAGQYLVLIPFAQHINVSKKYQNPTEKNRIKKILEKLRPPNFGIIARTASENVTAELLQQDIQHLMQKWQAIVSAIANSTPPCKVHSEISRTNSLLRDMLSVGFDSIITDDQQSHQEISNYLKDHHPQTLKLLKLYKTKTSLFEQLGIEKQIKTSFGRIVPLPSGAYLVVEHTEALHVFDVNSGSTRIQEENPEDFILKINIEAAVEIARQLRLRDMGGIIVIDFIDMRSLDFRTMITDRIEAEMKQDRAKHTVLPMSRFGLVQITRQRVRPQINIETTEICPSCQGSGQIQSSILISDEIEKTLDFLIRQGKYTKLTIKLNPYLASYFKIGFISRRLRWFLKYGKWIQILEEPAFPITMVRFFDETNEEIVVEP